MNKQNTPTPHISAEKGDIAERILLPGDPLRAKFIAENYFEDVKQFNSTRNMLGYTGVYKGEKISAMGTGMGCPSIGIYSYELINFYGCKTLLRVGTAGAMNENVNVRDIVIAMGACTTSNYIRLLGLPGDYSPLASWKLLKKAAQAAEKAEARYHIGNVLSSDMFYTPKIVQNGVSWNDMGVLAVEMETAALYANAALGKAEALSIFTVSDSLVTGEATSAQERETSFTKMIEIALETI